MFCVVCQKEPCGCEKDGECYKIVRDEVLGRCVVAARDIHPGEVVMKSSPLILGPKTVSSPMCLTCHKRLNLEEFRYDCRKCHWPLCNEQCELSPLHKPECEVFSKANYKPNIKNDYSRQSAYASIAPLRALLLKRTQPEKFDLLMTCQSHLDKHMSTPIYKILRMSLVPFFTNLLKLETNETEILKICSIFDTNCFEVRDPYGSINVRGIYPTVVFLSHDCKHNTKHCFPGDDFHMMVTATTLIKKGELITTTYTQTLWNTMERRSHLKMSKNFGCCCERCKDPTELGTYVGSTKCPQCENGMILSLDALDEDSDWRCDKCQFLVAGGEVAWRNENWKQEISNLDKRDPEEFENFLVKYDNVLHGKNSFCLQVKYALTQMYGNMDGFRLRELSNEILERKIQLCRELLDVAEVLEAGYSKFRGLLMYELFETMMEKVERGEKDLEKEAVSLLKKAEGILRFEPDLGGIVKEKMMSLGL